MMAPASAASAATGPALRDIHLPPAPSWWPLAPGWWGLLIVMLIALGWAAWWWRRRRQRRREALAVVSELDALVLRWRDQPVALATGLHQLMRRVALRYDASAGQRQGAAWRETLAMVPVDVATLDQLMLIEQAMYRPGSALQADRAIDATRRWLIRAWRHAEHRRGKALPSAAREANHA